MTVEIQWEWIPLIVWIVLSVLEYITDKANSDFYLLIAVLNAVVGLLMFLFYAALLLIWLYKHINIV